MGRGRVWRIHRSWPIALVLCVLLLFDLPLDVDQPYYDDWWLLPGAVLLIPPAVLAPRWPVRSSWAAAAALIVSSMAAHLAGARLDGSPSVTEAVAVAVIIAEVVRVAPARRAAVIVVLLAVAEGAASVMRAGLPELMTLLEDGPVGLVVTGIPVAVGLYLRGRDAAAADATRAAVAVARQRERVELARELHDAIAHHIGGIVVQAQAAQVVADPGAGVRLLPLAERAGHDAMTAMRRMVAVLRDDESGGEAPAPTMDLEADLHAVTATAPGGTPVRLSIDTAEPIPPVVGTSVLRLVQESVTNARRHAAGAREIAVTVLAEDGAVRVTVSDDGRPGGAPERYGGGFGLVGMRERVELLGGRFMAGREPGGGWRVAADLPLAAPAE